MGLDLSRIRIVLVEPRVPENIGMAARAMKNCGIFHLVLVRPVDHLSVAACRPAMEAFPLVQAAEVHNQLAEAIQGSRMVVGATRRGGQDRHPLLTPAAWIREVLPRAEGQEVSILFGAEKDGLTREATDRCDVLLTLPAHPDYGSFNLAQAVLLVCYELFRASPDNAAGNSRLELATMKEREEFFSHLESLLLSVGFLHENNPGRIMSSLRRLFGRAGLEERDIRILRGILSQVEWALKQGPRP
ncbi:MAG: RNA methyltransferase [Acidobacteria bacterium]|nr:RNA methyltransferase [Acidobacteriota bacterium]MCI0566967.1 RNA methyltransferase [Acidobacteriota bacterium]